MTAAAKDKPRMAIYIVQRSPDNGRYGPRDWRNYRRLSVWPITFASYGEAEAFMNTCFTFRGLEGRKMSAHIAWVGEYKRQFPKGLD